MLGMIIIFCCNTLNNKNVDSDYLNEYNTIKEIGVQSYLIDFEALVTNNNSKTATSKVPSMSIKQLAVYRGWMLKPEYYTSLYKILLTKNIQLINSPEEYQHCHYLPESYSIIKEYTPKSTSASKIELGTNFENIAAYTDCFGDKEIIVKDYVKSRKHEWNEACYIPKASDTENVIKIVQRLIELQGSDFNVGIVFREFVKLDFLATHPESNMPLSKEFRIFFAYGEPIYTTNYWGEGDYASLKPNVDEFLSVAKTIKSNFFTLDIARTEEGNWIIIELGDGQVAGLPDNAILAEFYTAFRDKIIE